MKEDKAEQNLKGFEPSCFKLRILYGKFYFRPETVWKTDSGKYISVWNDCMVVGGQVVVETIEPYGSCTEMK